MPHSSDGSRLKKDSFHEAYRFIEEDALEKVVEGLADTALASAAAEVIVDGILEEAIEVVCARCDLLRTATDESIPAEDDSEDTNNTQDSAKSMVETDVGDTRGDMIEDINTIISSFNALRVSSDGSLDERPILEDDIKKVISAMSSDFEWKFSSEEVLVTREGQGDVHTTEKVEPEVEVHDGGNQVPQIVSVEEENLIVTVNVLHRMLAELQEDNSEEESTGMTVVKHKTCTNAKLHDKDINRACENESASSKGNTRGENDPEYSNGTSLADSICKVIIDNGSSGSIKEEKSSNVIGEPDETNKTSEVRLRELPVVAQTSKFCHSYKSPRDVLGKNFPTSECINLKGKANSMNDCLFCDLCHSKQYSDTRSKSREKDEISKDSASETNENIMKCYLISTISDESDESDSVSAIAEWEDRNEQEVQIIDPDYDHSQEEGLLHLQPPLHRMEEYPWCYQVSSSDGQHEVGRDPQITKILRNVARHLRSPQQHVKTCRFEGYDVQPDAITSISVPSTSLEDSSQNRLPVILENNYYYSHEEDIPCIRKFAKSVDVAMSEVVCTYDNDTYDTGTGKDFVSSVTEEYISISDTSLLSTSVFPNSNEKPKILAGHDISLTSNPKGDSNFEAYNVQSKKSMTNPSSVKELTEQISNEGRAHKYIILNDPVNGNLNNGYTEETKIKAVRDNVAVDSKDEKEIHNVTVAPRIITLTIGPENKRSLLDHVEGKENQCERDIVHMESDRRHVDSLLISAEKRQMDDDDNVLVDRVNNLQTHGDTYKEHIYSTQPTSLSADQCDQFSVINFEQGLTREDVLLIQSKSPLIQISTDSSDQIILPNYNSIYEGDCVLKVNSHCMSTTAETHHVFKTINTKVAESDIVDNTGDKIYIFDDDHTHSEVNIYCMKMETSNRTIRPNTVQEPVTDNSQPQGEVHSSGQSNTIQVTNSHAEHDQASENQTYSGINYQVVLERTDQNHNSDETQQDLQEETGSTSQQDEQHSSEENDADVEVNPSLTDSNASTALHDSSTAMLTDTHNNELPRSAEGGSQVGLDDDGSIQSFEVHGYITSSFDSCDYSSCPDVESREELERSDRKEEGINAVESFETDDRISDISMQESSEIFNEYEITKKVENYDIDEFTLNGQISIESLDTEIMNQSAGTGILITELEATPLVTKVESSERESETSGECAKQLENNSVNIADKGREEKPIPEMTHRASYVETQMNARGRERDPDPSTVEAEKIPDLTEDRINVADIDTDNERSLEQAFSNVTSFEINANRMSQNSSDEGNFSRATLCLIDLNSGFINDYESSGLYDLYDDKSYQIFELSNSLTSADRMDIADRPFPHPIQSSPFDINEPRAVSVHVTSTNSTARVSGEYRDTVQVDEMRTLSSDLVTQKELSGDNYQGDSIDGANSSEGDVVEQGLKNDQSISRKEFASIDNDTEQRVLLKINNVEELSSNQKQMNPSGSNGVKQVSQSKRDIRQGIAQTSELEQGLNYRQDPLEVSKIKSRSCSEGDSRHSSEQAASMSPEKLSEPQREHPKRTKQETIQQDIMHANEILSESETLEELAEDSQGNMNKGIGVDTVRETEESLGQNSKEPTMLGVSQNEMAHESSHNKYNVIHTESNEVPGINEPLSFESHSEVDNCNFPTEGTTVSSKIFKHSDHKELNQNIADQSKPHSRAGYETNLTRDMKQSSNDVIGQILNEDIEQTLLEGPNPNLGSQHSAVDVSRATDIARALCFEKSLRDLLQLDVKMSTEVMVASDNVEGWRRVGLGVGIFPEDLTIHQPRKETHDPCKLGAHPDYAGNLDINSEQYEDHVNENIIASDCVEDVANPSQQDLNESFELFKPDSFYKSGDTSEIQDVAGTQRSDENIAQTYLTEETNVDGSYVADSKTSSACASDLKVDTIVETEEDIHDTMTISENIGSLKRLTDDIQQRTYWSSVGLITEQHHDELSLEAKDVTPELVQSDLQRLDMKHVGSKVSMGDQLLPDSPACDHCHEKKKLIEIGELIDEAAATVDEEIDSLKEIGATALPLGACSWEACEETISATTDIENSINVNDKCVDKKKKSKKWKLGGRVRRFFTSRLRISKPKLSNVSKK